ncbi:hypothetical protein ACHAXS_006102 [Conticribra weissflogii]
MMHPKELSTTCPPRDAAEEKDKEANCHPSCEKAESSAPFLNNDSTVNTHLDSVQEISTDYGNASSAKTAPAPAREPTFSRRAMLHRSLSKPSCNRISKERLFLRKMYKMISDEQWIEMDEFLRSPAQLSEFRGGSTRSLAQGSVDDDAVAVSSSMKDLSLSGTGNELSPLEVVHFACRFNPPRTIIRHLASLYPDGVTCPDNMGRLPLHHAVKWGASYRLICFLLEKDKSAASVKDISGKTPLHLLCEKYASAYHANNIEEISVEESMLGAAKLLVNVAPDTVNIGDNDEMTPIEYAIRSDCPFKVVRFLQKSSESSWKSLKLKMPDENHAHIEEKINRDQQDKQKRLELREMKRLSSRNILQYNSGRNLGGSARALGANESQSASLLRQNSLPYDHARIHESIRNLSNIEQKNEDLSSSDARHVPNLHRHQAARTAFAKSA